MALFASEEAASNRPKEPLTKKSSLETPFDGVTLVQYDVLDKYGYFEFNLKYRNRNVAILYIFQALHHRFKKELIQLSIDPNPHSANYRVGVIAKFS